MNILYISNLNGASWAGPSFSVPRQIGAQCNYDNVFWYNCTDAELEEWRKIAPFHTLEDFPKRSIALLAEPFNNPDLVVVEQFYNFAKNPILIELLRSKIPYVIVPRGELTRHAQNRKKIKKKIANSILFDRFAKNALAIQYLTEQERIDSGDGWNENSIIIPNGIEIANKQRIIFSQNAIKCVFIGRIEPYQKGLDLLVEACSKIKEELEKHNCTISIYGPDRENKLEGLKKIAADADIQHLLQFHDGVYGEEKEKVILNSDVFLMTSRFEGHPMALIEAMSYGLPCLVTKGTNMSKEVYDANAGWVSDNNVEGIMNAFLCMLSEKSDISNKGMNALVLSKEYNWTKIAQKSHHIYKEIVEK